MYHTPSKHFLLLSESQAQNKPLSAVTGDAATMYVHQSDEKIGFRHPIPLGDALQARIVVETPAYLSCITTTASFHPAVCLACTGAWMMSPNAVPKISAFVDKNFNHGPTDACSVLVLEQPNGSFAGLLRLMTKADLDEAEPCELVAISKGSVNAIDLPTSFEWEVFTTKNKSYHFEYTTTAYGYEPTWLGDKGKYALLMSAGKAFSEAGAMHGPLGPEFDGILSTIERIRLDKEATGWGFDFNICRESQRATREMWHEPQYRTSGDFVCEFYNVLWIERKDGVAYRRACGWVPKHIWEAHCTDPVEVKLG